MITRSSIVRIFIALFATGLILNAVSKIAHLPNLSRVTPAAHADSGTWFYFWYFKEPQFNGGFIADAFDINIGGDVLYAPYNPTMKGTSILDYSWVSPPEPRDEFGNGDVDTAYFTNDYITIGPFAYSQPDWVWDVTLTGDVPIDGPGDYIVSSDMVNYDYFAKDDDVTTHTTIKLVENPIFDMVVPYDEDQSDDEHTPTDRNTISSGPNSSTTCQPVNIARREKVEHATDVSIPAARGLSLNISRSYSSQMNYLKSNQERDVAFGWGNGNDGANWTFDMAETAIRKPVWHERQLSGGAVTAELKTTPVYRKFIQGNTEYETGMTGYCYVYDLQNVTGVAQYELHQLAYQSIDGGTTYFSYGGSSVSSDVQLRLPWDPDFAKPAWVSTFVPVSAAFVGSDSATLGRRQTTEDVKIYMFHAYEEGASSPLPQPLTSGQATFSDTTPNLTYGADGYGTLFKPFGLSYPRTAYKHVSVTMYAQREPDLTRMGCTGYVVRYGDGRQYYYSAGGKLICFDLDWHNNAPDSDPAHIDDYYVFEWSGNRVASIQAAPKTDGRKLILNYNVHGALEHVDLALPAGQGSTITNLVNYEYFTSGDNTGQLKRVMPKNSNEYGVQYDYGNLAVDVENNSVGPTAAPSGKDPKLAMVSRCKGGTVLPIKGIMYDYSPSEEPFPVVEEWLFDDNGEDSDWRKYQSFEEDTVIYEAGQRTDGGDRYDGLAGDSGSKPKMVYTFNDRNDVEEVNYVYGSGTSPLPRRRTVYIPGTRLASGVQILVGTDPEIDDHWVTETQNIYVDPSSGIGKISSTIRYSDFSESSGDYTATGPLTTSYVYGNGTFPDKPTQVTGPDGSRTEVTYDALGRAYQITKKMLNSGTSAYDTMSSTTLAFLPSGANKGQLYYAATTQGGVKHATNYVYYDAADYSTGKVVGMLKSSTVDSQPATTYKYNAFGQVTSIVNDGKTTTYAYSTGDYPPKLVSVTDPTSAVNYSYYDQFGNLQFSKNAANQLTHYYYDTRGNLVRTDVPDASSTTATTRMTYDIYDRMTLLKDAQGNGTVYDYDELNRQKQEAAFGADTGSAGYGDQDPLYKIQYAYSGWTSGCGCGGGGSGQIASRTIVKGDDAGTHQKLSYTYDFLGRMKTQLDDVTNRQVEYHYTGLKLTSIDHDGGLWADDSLSYAYDDKYGRLTREVYPNGRYTEFGYDANQRLASVKDPFGFIEKLAYDGSGRLSTAAHSTLGQSTLTYNSDDTLQRLALGNGAYTDYTYDTYKRLTAFDLRQPDTTQMVKHDWSYDSLGRKDQAVNVASDLWYPDNYVPATFSLPYDAAGRLHSEELQGYYADAIWSQDYAYDKVGNRTLVSVLGGINKTLGYGAGNRETSVSGGGTALTYDYKGNVTVRPPLAGGNAFNYAWNAYDQLTTATRTGANTVSFNYDALGRMLMRNEAATTPVTTVKYWLGLAPLAEEEWGTESGRDQAVFRPDLETASTPEDAGWGPIGWGPVTQRISYATDADRGKVVRLWSTDSAGSVYAIGDTDQNLWNPTSGSLPWHDASGRKHVGMWMKLVGMSYAIITPCVTTIDSGSVVRERFINMLTNVDYWAPYMIGDGLYMSIGAQTADGQWCYVEADLEAQLHRLLPDETITAVNGIIFNTKEAYIDDITFSGGVMKRSYQVLPGAAIGGVLGSQTGPNVIADNGNTVRYFQYNDLGTVQAQTLDDGSVEGVWEPDFFGNYENRWAYSGSPARPELGLTGKQWDLATGLYSFPARWYDPERGQFMSQSPFAMEIEHPFTFAENQPINLTDSTGLLTDAECGALWAEIMNHAQLLIDELNKYDPIQDALGGHPMRGGKLTVPGGHFEEMQNLIRGIKKDLLRYLKECILKNKNGPRYPKKVDEMANRPIPTPCPYANSFSDWLEGSPKIITQPSSSLLIPPIGGIGGYPIIGTPKFGIFPEPVIYPEPIIVF